MIASRMMSLSKIPGILLGRPDGSILARDQLDVGIEGRSGRVRRFRNRPDYAARRPERQVERKREEGPRIWLAPVSLPLLGRSASGPGRRPSHVPEARRRRGDPGRAPGRPGAGMARSGARVALTSDESPAPTDRIGRDHDSHRCSGPPTNPYPDFLRHTSHSSPGST
jgi:hypothetical protein